MRTVRVASRDISLGARAHETRNTYAINGRRVESNDTIILAESVVNIIDVKMKTKKLYHTQYFDALQRVLRMRSWYPSHACVL